MRKAAQVPSPHVNTCLTNMGLSFSRTFSIQHEVQWQQDGRAIKRKNSDSKGEGQETNSLIPSLPFIYVQITSSSLCFAVLRCCSPELISKLKEKGSKAAWSLF